MAKKEVTYKFGANTAEIDKKLAAMSSKMKDFGRSMQNIGKSMSMYVTAPIMALGGLALQSGAELDTLRNSYSRMTKTMGIDADKMLAVMKKSSRGTIAENKLLLSANKAMSLGVVKNTEEMATIMEIARVKGQTMGLSMTQAFDDLVTGLGRGSAMILDNLGITIKVGEVNEQYARSIGKVASELTAEEQKMALVNAVVSQGKKELADMGEVTLTNQEKLSQMTTKLTEMKNEIGAQLLPYAVKLAETLGVWIEKFTNLDDTTKKIVVVIAGLAAAIGPLLTALGFMVKTIIPALIAGGKMIAAAWWPLVAIIAGVSAAMYLLNRETRKVNALIEELDKQTTEQLRSELEQLRAEVAEKTTPEIEKLKNEYKELEEQLSNTEGSRARIAIMLKMKEVSDKLKSSQSILAKTDDEETKAKYRRIDAIQQILKARQAEIEANNKFKSEIDGLIPTLKEENIVLGEIGGKIESISTKLLAVSEIVAEPFKKLGQTIYDLMPISDTVAVRFIQMFDAVGNKIRDTREVIIDLGKELSYLATDVLVSLAESMGNAFNGGTFEDGLNALLITVADWAKQFGAVLIAAGIASQAFQKSLAANPLLAIGAGVALIAAATAVKGALSKDPTQGGSGGGYSGGGGNKGSDLFGMRELGQFTVAVTGTLRADGSELVTVIENENKRTSL